MSVLTRWAGALVPTEPAPEVWRAPEPSPLREILGGPLEGRLAAAVEAQDDAAVDRLLDVLLDHPYLGRRLAGRVIVRTGQALAGVGPPG